MTTKRQLREDLKIDREWSITMQGRAREWRDRHAAEVLAHRRTKELLAETGAALVDSRKEIAELRNRRDELANEVARMGSEILKRDSESVKVALDSRINKIGTPPPPDHNARAIADLIEIGAIPARYLWVMDVGPNVLGHRRVEVDAESVRIARLAVAGKKILKEQK